MKPPEMDAVLSMLDLEELREALETIDAWEDRGRVSHSDAALWRERIRAWSRPASLSRNDG